MQVFIQTLGCKVNQYETQAMELLLTQRGHKVVSADEAVDAYVVNSCSVTATSDRKTKQALRQAKKKHPEAVIAVCGCYPQVSTQDAMKQDVDLIAGTSDRVGFLTLLEEAWQSKKRIISVKDVMKRAPFEHLPSGGLGVRTRAMLKVQDGCSNFCSYCIIPYTRGPIRSLPIEFAVIEAKKLAQEGYREIVLTGIELSSWGKDLEAEPSLITLIEQVCLALPDCRVRLGSLKIQTMTEEFCQRLGELPNFCAHFHLSLQSGCDETLSRMNRKYTASEALACIEHVRQVYPDAGVTTDLIVGFPGETEEEFAQTLAFVKTCGFSDMHVFPYSIREGTKAATMPNQISKAEKTRRAKEVSAVANAMKLAYHESMMGKDVEVLLEEQVGDFWRGHSTEYIPVLMQGDYHKNDVVQATVTACAEDTVYANKREGVL